MNGVPHAAVSARAEDLNDTFSRRLDYTCSSELNRHEFLEVQPIASTMLRRKLAMEKKAPLGVHKNKPKRSKRILLNKVVDYLKSDSYMFAPLISPLPSHSAAHETICSSSPGEEIPKPLKHEDEKLVKQLGEFLKSDSYMYASLIHRQTSDFPAIKFMGFAPTGPFRFLKRAASAISMRKKPVKISQPIEESAKEREHQPTEVNTPVTSIGVNETPVRGQREMVKHIVHQNRRPSSLPGRRTVKSQRRKLM
ncbi:uncharacterized protein LOC131157643 [Malania oleifera]|uniref:uncharacterized protein LOC131157643 n=1 Tax=Malania oleifera TaxID=397392 RepID=UPI0025AE8519|nr:uncharacterized protein LOC131157643 [Malania oleifera]